MTARNFEQFIDEAIASVMAQDYPAIELIVVDDASTDKTTEKIQRWAAHDSRIVAIYNTQPVLPPKGRNIAVSRSHGEYLAILDSDDVALPDRTRVQVEYLESHSDIAAAGSHAETIDKNSTTIGFKHKSKNISDIRFAMLLQSQFIHSSMMIRRSVFEEFGGYRNEYVYAEDYDLFSRMLEKYLVTNVDKVLIKFRSQSGGVTTQSGSQKIQMESSLKVTLRNCAPYIAFSPEKTKLLTDMMNNKDISLFETLKALRMYTKLTHAYLNKSRLVANESSGVLEIYRNKRLAILIGRLKKLLTF